MTDGDDKNTGNADENARNFAQVLQYLAAKRNWSYKYIAKLTGIDPRTIEDHITGKTNPRFEHTQEYIRLFGADLADAFLAPAKLRAVTVEGGVDSEILKALEPVIRKHFPDMKYGGGE